MAVSGGSFVYISASAFPMSLGLDFGLNFNVNLM